MAGLKRLAENKDFTRSDSVDKLFAEFQIENNPILQFTDEIITYDKNSTNYITSDDLYSSYEAWATSNGYRPMNIRNFGKEIASIYGDIRIRKRIDNQRVYVYEGLLFSRNIKPTNVRDLFK